MTRPTGSTPKKPTTNPVHYKTLAGLLRAVERALYWKHRGCTRVAGMLVGQYIQNAEFAAEKFGDTTSVRSLCEKWTITRGQDLLPTGHSSPYGQPDYKRPYGVGDNVPGVGRITEEVTLPDGCKQFLVAGMWMHERCFEKRPA